MIESGPEPEETLKLAPEQMEMIRLADEAFARGEGYSFEEVMQHSKDKVRVWLPDQSA